MARFFIFRHGETDWNRQKRWQGHTDIPLNELGRSQAMQLSTILAGYQFDHIFCSDMLRAEETLKLALGPVSYSTAKELREVNGGDAEGLTREELHAQYGPDSWQRWGDPHDLDFSFPGGETKRMVKERVLNFLSSLSEPNLKIAIFTHGGVLHATYNSCQNVEVAKLTIGNCTGFVFDHDESGWRFVKRLDLS